MYIYRENVYEKERIEIYQSFAGKSIFIGILSSKGAKKEEHPPQQMPPDILDIAQSSPLPVGQGPRPPMRGTHAPSLQANR